MRGVKRPANDWYSPYFTPTTIIVAAAVLFLSVQAGKFAGNVMVAQNKAQYAQTATTAVKPTARRVPTKAAHHASPAQRNSSPLAKPSR